MFQLSDIICIDGRLNVTWQVADVQTSSSDYRERKYMVTDQGPVVQSVLLRSELCRLRNESGLTQEQVVNDLERSPSKVIRFEAARGSVAKVCAYDLANSWLYSHFRRTCV
jgi:hypothetical protein